MAVFQILENLKFAATVWSEFEDGFLDKVFTQLFPVSGSSSGKVDVND